MAWARQPQVVPKRVPPQAATQQTKETMICYSTADKDEIGIRTLVGEYQEEGTNHSRKFYKKTQKIPGHEDIEVFLYFWDDRDGPSFSGWWFGNQVGGAQVWSRNQQTTLAPPKSGWTIPWDGQVKKELLVVPASEKQALDKKEALERMEARKQEEGTKLAQNVTEEWEARVQKATETAADAEIDTSSALERANEVLQGDLDDAQVMEAQKELSAQAKSLAEAQRAIAIEAVAAQKAPPALKAEMVALGERMRKLQTQVKEGLGKLKNSKQAKAKMALEEAQRQELESKERELEGAHSQQLEEMMPAALEKVDTAEDEVEKVAIAAAPLQIDTADDLRPVMLQAIKETEQRTRAAQAAIGEARRYISGKLSQVQHFVTATKKQAVEEFTVLQTKLNEAQKKLTPYKTIRQDYEQRVQAKKLYDELSSKLAGAEIEVEKAAMMTAPLGGDSSEGIKETETALGAAQSALSQTSRLIESKLRSADRTPGPLQDEIKALQERTKLAQTKLDEVRKTVKETQARVAADTLLREVSEKVSTAEDELQKMAEAELPFLRGEKVQDMATLIAGADKVAAKVHSAIADAQTFVAKKLVEVARFTEGPAKTVKEEIDMMQKRLEEGRDRLQQFRGSTADRKRAFLLEEVDAKVTAAENEVRRLNEAAGSIHNLGTAGDAPTESLLDNVEQANLAERAAQASIVVARKYLLQKTAELKKLAITGSGSGSEIGKLQTRVNAMQQEITKLRSATQDAEERIRVKQMLNEVALRLHAAESEVEKVSSVSVPLVGEQPSAEAVDRLGKAMASAETKLGSTGKLVDVKLKSATGFLKDELVGMRARITAAEKKLEMVTAAAKEQKERLEAAELIEQAGHKVEVAEAALAKLSEAELPFIKGIEVLDATVAGKAVAVCEAAATAASRAITEARAFVVQKLVDCKNFSDGPSDATTKDLLTLQSKLDAATAKLNDMKKDTVDRKRRTQMQASGEKISHVEATVKKLTESMDRFSDEKLTTISAESARKVCEDIASAEQDAQSAVAEAKKFLAARAVDLKHLAESERETTMRELTKLQGRLTQSTVDLAKLSKTCTEREQRFVAQKLVQDATETFELLRTDVQTATKAVAPLLAEDRTGLLTGAYTETFVLVLQGFAKKSGATPESLWANVSKSKTANAKDFTKFIGNLPQLTGNPDASFTDAQAASIMSSIGAEGGKLGSLAFQALLNERCTCRARVVAMDKLEGGKQVGYLEPGEGVEVLETGEDSEGNKRAKCRMARDGATVWVTLSDKGGAKYFKPSPAGLMDSLEASAAAIHNRITEAAEAVEMKALEVSSVKQGPLAQVKTQLYALRTKFSAEQSKTETLKKRASAAKAAVLQQVREEMQKVQEVKCKAFAEQSVKEGTAAVEAAEKKAEKVIEGSKLSGKEKPSIAQLESMKTAADDALQGLAEARATVSRALEAHEAYKGSARNLLLEARVDLTKLTARTTASERKLRTATEAVRTAHLQVVKAATKQAREALRAASRQTKSTADQLFSDASNGKDLVTEAQFTKWVETVLGSGLSKESATLVYKEFGRYGMRKQGFMKAMQEFATCSKEVPITDKLAAAASTVRKLNPGEMLEVLEGPKEDAATQSVRVRGRALRDSAEGWVTVKAQGTTFIKPREKPFMWASRDAPMHQNFDDKSPVVRTLIRDEVLELLEGPREEIISSSVYLKATTCKDSAIGWITLRDSLGGTFAALGSNVYVCKSTIAMTDVFDIKNCNVVRKVDIGEALIVCEGQGAQADAETAIKRLKFRSAVDGKEGFVTLKGNQGTVYVEPSKSHYSVVKATSLREAMNPNAAVARQLQVGDVLEGIDPPKEVRPEARMVVRARSFEDGKSGWIFFEPGPSAPVKPWSSKYTCKVTVGLTPSLAYKEGEVVRSAQPGEAFEAIDGPLLDPSTKTRRIRCATAADGVVGWATLRSSDGTAFLEVV